MITERKTLDLFRNFRHKLNDFGDYKSLTKELPEELRSIMAENKKLEPRHCTVDVIREFYLERLTAIQPAFAMDQHAAPAVELISQRIALSGDFESLSASYRLNKGIMLLGPVGSGKTLLMKGIIDVYRFFDINIQLLPTYSLTEAFTQDGVNIYKDNYFSGKDIWTTVDGLMIDDFGAEAIASHYGQVTNVVAEVMLRRYDKQAITFGTSNLDQKTLRRFYGERVWSRMRSMFNFIELKGNDRRQ